MQRRKPLERKTPMERVGFRRADSENGREGMRSTARRRAATAPSDFLDGEGRYLPLPPKTKPQRKPKARPSFRRSLGPCALCGTKRRHRQAHHGLPAQHIRAYVEGLRLPDPEERKLMIDLLSDKRNRIPACATCHPLVEHDRALARHKVPPSVFAFAAQLGERYVARLERMYPVLSKQEEPPWRR